MDGVESFKIPVSYTRYPTTFSVSLFTTLTPKGVVRLSIMDDFKKQYGIGKRFDKYFIAFEPTFAFVKMFNDENIS